jgi:glycosyltransferase involved in cell wall biosynthesis
MEKEPLVSIIIPTYNRAYLISETMNSVLAQTYQNWECIIVDDGSTDNTEALIKEYSKKDGRFQYFIRPPDLPKGVSNSRNFGLEKSKGELINFFDSDDIMLTGFLKKRIEVFMQYPETDVVFCAFKCFNENTLRDKIYNGAFSGDIIDDLLNSKVSFGPLCFLIKKAALEGLRFDPEIHSSEDTDFFFNLFVSKDLVIRNVSEILYHVRRHEHSIVSNLDKKGGSISSMLTVNKKLLHYSIKQKKDYGIIKYKKRCLLNFKIMADNKNFYLAFKHLFSFNDIRYKDRIKLFLILILILLTGKGSYKIKNLNI